MLIEPLKNIWNNPAHRTKIKLGIGLVLLLVVVYLYTTYTVVRVSVSVSESNLPTKNIKVQGYNSQALGAAAQPAHAVSVDSLQILPRTVDYFEVTSPLSETIQSSDGSAYSWWPYNAVSIELQPQKHLEKVSTSGGACPLAGEGGETYAYRCSNAQHVFHQDTSVSPWNIEVTANTADLQSVVPYKSGLLGIQSAGDLRLSEPLVYVNPADGARTYYSLPKELTGNALSVANITTDSTDQSSPYVLFTSHKAKAFYVIHIEKGEVVAKIPYPEDAFTSSSNISCYIVEREASCYIGTYTDSPEHQAGSAQGYDTTSKQPQSSYVYSFSMKEKDPSIDKNKLPSGYIKKIVRDSQGTVYAIDAWDNLVRIKADGSRQLIARQIDQVNYVDRLIFTKDSNLYEFDAEARVSHLLYKDSGLNLSSITTYGRQLVSMFATDGVSTSDDIYIFALSDKEYLPTDGERTSKILSLYGSEDVQSVDYTEDKAQIVLKVPVISNHQTGTLEPLQPQYNRAKSEVENRVEAMKLDKLEIEYLP